MLILCRRILVRFVVFFYPYSFSFVIKQSVVYTEIIMFLPCILSLLLFLAYFHVNLLSV